MSLPSTNPTSEFYQILEVTKEAKKIRQKILRQQRLDREKQASVLYSRVMTYLASNKEKIIQWAETGQRDFVVRLPILPSENRDNLFTAFHKVYSDSDSGIFGGFNLYKTETDDLMDEYIITLRLN